VARGRFVCWLEGDRKQCLADEVTSVTLLLTKCVLITTCGGNFGQLRGKLLAAGLLVFAVKMFTVEVARVASRAVTVVFE
jgi:hypothetical protein